MSNRIIDLRKDLDLTQEQIAKKLGYYTTTYARWEKNPLQMKLDDLINLARFHNVSLDYIAGLTNDKRGIGYNIETQENSHSKYNIKQSNSGGKNVIKIKDNKND